MEILNDWVFHFNPFTKTWAAVHRSDYLEYWNNQKSKKILRSSKIETLIELLVKSDGDIKAINKMIS